MIPVPTGALNVTQSKKKKSTQWDTNVINGVPMLLRYYIRKILSYQIDYISGKECFASLDFIIYQNDHVHILFSIMLF